MPSFAVNASQELIDEGKDLLSSVQKEGETQGDALKNVFALAKEALANREMKSAGIEVEGLDESLSTIRAIILGYAADIKLKADKRENDVQKLIGDQKDEIDAVHKQLRRALDEADNVKQQLKQTSADLDYEKKRHAEVKTAYDALCNLNSSRESLISEKQSLIDRLQEQVNSLEDVRKEYESIKIINAKQESEIDKSKLLIDELEQKIENQKKQNDADVKAAVTEVELTYQNRLNCAEAAFAKEKLSLIDTQHNLSMQVNSLEKDNAILKMEIERLKKEASADPGAANSTQDAH